MVKKENKLGKYMRVGATLFVVVIVIFLIFSYKNNNENIQKENQKIQDIKLSFGDCKSIEGVIEIDIDNSLINWTDFYDREPMQYSYDGLLENGYYVTINGEPILKDGYEGSANVNVYQDYITNNWIIKIYDEETIVLCLVK